MAFFFVFVFVGVASSFLAFLFVVVDFLFPSSSSAWRFREAAARPRMHALERGPLALSSLSQARLRKRRNADERFAKRKEKKG